MVVASKGCLTCRRRKVRCDETRPNCLNCQKSSRKCGGYRQTPNSTPLKTSALIIKGSDLPSRSRSGCTTCKSRKLKCDETWPVCQRCLRAGRPCRRDIPASSNGQVDLEKITFYTSASNTSLSKSPSLHPDSTWSEQRAVAFFHQRTAYHISGCNNSAHRWFDYLLAVGESEPAIKHAVIALGSLHEEFEAVSSPPYSTYTPLQTLPESHLSIQQYDKALQLIAVASPWQNRDTPLIACLLFAAFDSLRGRPEPALFHRCSGLRILSETSFEPSSPLEELMHCVFLRFDTENLELGEPNFFSNYGQPFSFPLITRPLQGFSTLKQACVTFEVLFNRILRAIKQPLQIRAPRSGIGPNPHLPDILQRYSEWCYALNEYLRASAMRLQNVGEDGISDLVIVQLRRLLLRIILHVDIRHTEMDFDNFTPEFAAIVELAECYANGCSRVDKQGDPHPPDFKSSPLPNAQLEHWTDRIHQKSPQAYMQCPRAANPPQAPSSCPRESPSTGSEGASSIPATRTGNGITSTSVAYTLEPRFAGPRRQLLGITAANTPVVPSLWPAIDTDAVSSAISTFERLPISSPPSSYSSTTTPASSTTTFPNPRAPFPQPSTSTSTSTPASPRSQGTDRTYAPSTFSLSPGIIAPLYVTATHCRHPLLRRRALRLLESVHRKEGQWDSLVCAANARAILEAEEGRAGRLRVRRGGGGDGDDEGDGDGAGAVGVGGGGEVEGMMMIPEEARVREIEAVMHEGLEGGEFERGVKEGTRRRFEWRAVGGGGARVRGSEEGIGGGGLRMAREKEWSVVVPGCTTQ